MTNLGIRTALASRFGDQGRRLMEEIEALRDSHLAAPNNVI
jgi:hypothetical protein